MSALMQNAVKEASTVRDKLKVAGNTFLKCREVLEHEAIARLCGLPLRSSNQTVQFLATCTRDKRTLMLKTPLQLQELDDDDYNVYLTNVIGNYPARQTSIEDLSLAEFVSEYALRPSSKHNTACDNLTTHSNVDTDQSTGRRAVCRRC